MRMKASHLAAICAVFALQPVCASAEQTVAVYVAKNGHTLTATFNDQDDSVSLLLPDKHQVRLQRAAAASGIRYTLGRQEFWSHRDEASYSVGGKTMFQGREKAAP